MNPQAILGISIECGCSGGLGAHNGPVTSNEGMYNNYCTAVKTYWSDTTVMDNLCGADATGVATQGAHEVSSTSLHFRVWLRQHHPHLTSAAGRCVAAWWCMAILCR
jgi:hypothetical protein